MTNKLDYFFEKYNFSDKNKFDTLQIFSLLSDGKKKQFVANFKSYAKQVAKLEKDFEIEKAILLDAGVEKVKDALLKQRKIQKNK